MTLKKAFAEAMIIEQKPKQVGDYLYQFSEKWLCDIRDKWDDFLLDKLYDLYKEEGFTRVMMVSREDFKKFLMWAIQIYREEMLKDDK